MEERIEQAYLFAGLIQRYRYRDDPLASYLDVEAVVDAVKSVGADAVHPGYGFLAENPNLARRLTEEGITFIGPSPEILELLEIRYRPFRNDCRRTPCCARVRRSDREL